MILFLSIKDSIITISVIGKDEFIFKNEIFEQNENLAISVDRLLKRHRIGLKNLKAVVIGDIASGFTASRSLTAFANTLVLALNIKVAKLKNPSTEVSTFIKQIHKSVSLRKNGQIISPEYSGPVSITLSKSK